MSTHALITSGEDVLVRRFKTALDEVGFPSQTVAHTGAAIAALDKDEFVAMLVDCDLEGGMDLMDLVRRDERNKRTLIVACVSGHQAARDASRMGANFVLTKPINWEIAKRMLKAAQTMIIRERRGNIREKIHIPASFTCNDQLFEAHLTDMSENGLSLEVDARLEVGAQVQVVFKLPNGRKPVQCTCKVAWAKSGHVGVEFLYLSAANAQMIMSWLTRHSPRHRMATT